MHHNKTIQRTKPTMGIIVLGMTLLIGCMLSAYVLFTHVNLWLAHGDQMLVDDPFIVVKIGFNCVIASFFTLAEIYLCQRKKRAKRLSIQAAGISLSYIILSQLTASW